MRVSNHPGHITSHNHKIASTHADVNFESCMLFYFKKVVSVCVSVNKDSCLNLGGWGGQKRSQRVGHEDGQGVIQTHQIV